MEYSANDLVFLATFGTVLLLLSSHLWDSVIAVDSLSSHLSLNLSANLGCFNLSLFEILLLFRVLFFWAIALPLKGESHEIFYV